MPYFQDESDQIVILLNDVGEKKSAIKLIRSFSRNVDIADNSNVISIKFLDEEKSQIKKI